MQPVMSASKPSAFLPLNELLPLFQIQIFKFLLHLGRVRFCFLEAKSLIDTGWEGFGQVAQRVPSRPACFE